MDYFFKIIKKNYSALSEVACVVNLDGFYGLYFNKKAELFEFLNHANYLSTDDCIHKTKQ
ncbi:MAG: hypothetical protein JNL70_18335 [Saprospiraceae bacterium]|nr:hypothetical protein [Saprospiraceae bacterium]